MSLYTVRDAIVKIGQQMEQFSILSHLTNQESLDEILGSYTSQITYAFIDCTSENDVTRDHRTIPYPRGFEFVAVLSASPLPN